MEMANLFFRTSYAEQLNLRYSRKLFILTFDTGFVHISVMSSRHNLYFFCAFLIVKKPFSVVFFLIFCFLFVFCFLYISSSSLLELVFQSVTICLISSV